MLTSKHQFDTKQDKITYLDNNQALILINELVEEQERPITTFNESGSGETESTTEYETVTVYSYDGYITSVSDKTESGVLKSIKENVIAAIKAYDTSCAVNNFLFNGKWLWVDKSTRVGLMNSITIEKNAGKENTVMWFNGDKIELSCESAIQFLSMLEMYALTCYNVTAAHEKAVEGFTTVDEILNYDYTSGYPEKLRLGM